MLPATDIIPLASRFETQRAWNFKVLKIATIQYAHSAKKACYDEGLRIIFC